MSGKTKAQLETELKSAQEELEVLRAANGDVVSAIEAYKARVKQRALKAKTEHEWCEEIDDILKDLDIDPAMPRFRFTAMIPATFEVTPRNLPDDPDQYLAEWISASLNAITIQDALDGVGQESTYDQDALLGPDWDTYRGYDATNSWSVKVDKITVQDVESIST